MSWWAWLLTGAIAGVVVTFAAWWWTLARPHLRTPRRHDRH